MCFPFSFSVLSACFNSGSFIFTKKKSLFFLKHREKDKEDFPDIGFLSQWLYRDYEGHRRKNTRSWDLLFIYLKEFGVGGDADMFCPHMTSTARSQEQQPGLRCWWQGSKYSGHSPFLAHEQMVRLEVEQLGLKPTLVLEARSRHWLNPLGYNESPRNTNF